MVEVCRMLQILLSSRLSTHPSHASEHVTMPTIDNSNSRHRPFRGSSTIQWLGLLSPCHQKEELRTLDGRFARHDSHSSCESPRCVQGARPLSAKGRQSGVPKRGRSKRGRSKRGRSQKHANARKRAQMTAKESNGRSQKHANARKRAQMTVK